MPLKPEPRDRLGTNAEIAFVLALRGRWADTLYPALNRQYHVACARDEPTSNQASRGVLHSLPAYPWFAFLERASQKLLWRAVRSAVADSEELDGSIKQELIDIELDPELELPSWYTDHEIHLQPGGVWSSKSSALEYELGAKLVMLGQNDDYGFHRLFVETAIPNRSYRSIVDLGCGFGKSTWPLKLAFPAAKITGVDLSAPCLELASRRSAARGIGIRYRQSNAADTGLEPGTFDLVTSTMLVHELPIPEIERVLRESYRLLAPGGLLRFLDFQRTGDPVRDLAMTEHGDRNNEPYLPQMMDADLVEMATRAGFREVGWVAFDERGAGRLENLTWPPRPEWHFPWAVLEGAKP